MEPLSKIAAALAALPILKEFCSRKAEIKAVQTAKIIPLKTPNSSPFSFAYNEAIKPPKKTARLPTLVVTMGSALLGRELLLEKMRARSARSRALTAVITPTDSRRAFTFFI